MTFLSLLTTKDLCKNYGKTHAIKDINIKIFEGDVFALIGPKGSGKSTLINVLLDFIRPTKGSAQIFDMDCQADSHEIKKFVGYMPSNINFYNNMKVYQILEYSMNFYENIDQPYVESLCDILKIDLNKKFKQLSLNHKKRVALANSLIHKPRLLIMDEPLAGLSHSTEEIFLEIIARLRKQGVSILYAGENLWEIENLCDSIAIIQDGQILESKDIDQIDTKRGKYVQVIVDGDIQELAMSLGAEEYMKKDGIISFVYYSDVDRLIKSLSKHTVYDLKIENVSLEKTLISYADKNDTDNEFDTPDKKEFLTL